MAEKEPITVAVDEDILDLIPSYLENRWKDMKAMDEALAAGDFETIRVLGHQLKGSGGGYGMDLLTELGGGLEEAAKVGNGPGVAALVERVKDFLERVHVVAE